MCSNHYAVECATSFCPVCGPRPATTRVLEAISAAREALAVEERLGEDERETLRAAGVFERFAVDAIESTVRLFEMFTREQFARRVADAATHTTGRGSVPRLDDTAVLRSAIPSSTQSAHGARLRTAIRGVLLMIIAARLFTIWSTLVPAVVASVRRRSRRIATHTAENVSECRALTATPRER